MAEPDLPALIATVSREVGMRRRVYPRRVAQGKMPQAEADREIAAMEAVLNLLKGLHQPRMAI
jgi:hypothetical protein